MSYTPPSGSSVGFSIADGYTPPAGGTIDFALGETSGAATAFATGGVVFVYAGSVAAERVARVFATTLAYADRTTEIFSRKAVLPRTSDGNVVLSFSNKASKTVVSDTSTTQEVNR